MRSNRGLTLVELLVSLSVAGILLASAAPSYRQFVERQQAAGLHNRLMAQFAFARSQAILQRANTVLCPSALGDERCRSGGNWGERWLVFVDQNGNFQRDDNETVLSVDVADLPSGWRLVSSAYRPRVRYRPNGMAQGGNLSIRLCQGSAPYSAIVMNNAGRPRIDREPKGGCE